jgi:predicted enzyme related to lactoylglutathione lyase
MKGSANELRRLEDSMSERTSYAPGIPCWVDLGSPDLDASVEFYKALFGWDADVAPQTEAGGYTMFSLNGKYVAAGSPPQQEGMPSFWTTYLASDDVDATAAKIRDAGGTVFMDPFDVFDSGRMTIAQDPTGATFGVWQAGNHIGAQLANEPGTMNWNECQTTDAGAAAAFYEQVFGVEVKDYPPQPGMPPYRVIEVDGRGVAGIFEINERMGDTPPNWSTIFAVADTDETVARVKELGGTAMMEGMDLPEIGRLAVLQDPTGAVFQVLQPPPES